MRTTLLILVGLAAFAFGLVTRMPAAAVAAWTQANVPDLTIRGATGTALDGRAARVLYQDLTLESVEWRTQPWTLLLGRASADIRAATDTGGLQATITRSFLGGGIALSDVDGTASLGWLAQRAGYTFVPVSGRLRLDLTQLTLTSTGDVESTTGTLEASSLRWELINPPAQLGRLGAIISAESGAITLEITDSDGPLAAEGNARLQPGGSYRLDFRLRARTEAEPRLKKLLSELGDADTNGWYRIRERGQL